MDETQFKNVLDCTESWKEEGTKLLCGGGAAADRGYFIQPTVFGDVQDGMTIAKEEVSTGPALWGMFLGGAVDSSVRHLDTVTQQLYLGQILALRLGQIVYSSHLISSLFSSASYVHPLSGDLLNLLA